MADDGEADGAAAPPGGEEALIGGVDPKLLRKALKKRVLYIEKHMETLSMKQLRRLLEQDLALVAQALDAEPHRGYIVAKVEEVVKMLLETAMEAAKAAEKPRLGVSAKAQQLKALLKAATIAIPPQTHSKAGGDEAVFCELLEALLQSAGLTADATPADCERVKKRKEQERDLEGIDASNIVQGQRRAAADHHAFVAPPAAAPRAPGAAVIPKPVPKPVTVVAPPAKKPLLPPSAAKAPALPGSKKSIQEWEDDG